MITSAKFMYVLSADAALPDLFKVLCDQLSGK